MPRKAAIAGAIDQDVHVNGPVSFLRLAETVGYDTVFLGPAQPVARFIAAIREHDPEIVGVGYRLTPQVFRTVLEAFRAALDEAGLRAGRRFVFGGTPPCVEAARESGLFDATFTGTESLDEVVAWLKGESLDETPARWGRTALERIARRHPFPILRHHFGRPTVADTEAGIRQIAEAGVLDVVSLGTDQNAQEFFFRPGEMRPELDGAGGVPIRTPDDLRRLKEAAQRGNFPLMRCYAGTNDLLRWAEMLVETIDQAWGTVPLTWYSVLDGRSKRRLPDAIRENQAAVKFYADAGKPVEINEPHHWALRDAHDAVFVAMAYLVAYNARALGVKDFFAQYMFNTPPHESFAMDLAKMYAARDLIQTLEGDSFAAYQQCRSGLLLFHPDPLVAKGQLGASITMLLGLEPSILHVVGFAEGDHATTAEELIEACQIAHGVLRNAVFGLPDYAADPQIAARRAHLRTQAETILAAVRALGEVEGCDGDPLTDPDNLARAIKTGIIDAPHLQGNVDGYGQTVTRVINGAVDPVDPDTLQPITDEERIARLRPDLVRRLRAMAVASTAR